jgi:hypothetical protein
VFIASVRNRLAAQMTRPDDIHFLCVALIGLNPGFSLTQRGRVLPYKSGRAYTVRANELS